MARLWKTQDHVIHAAYLRALCKAFENDMCPPDEFDGDFFSAEHLFVMAKQYLPAWCDPDKRVLWLNAFDSWKAMLKTPLVYQEGLYYWEGRLFRTVPPEERAPHNPLPNISATKQTRGLMSIRPCPYCFSVDVKCDDFGNGHRQVICAQCEASGPVMRGKTPPVRAWNDVWGKIHWAQELQERYFQKQNE